MTENMIEHVARAMEPRAFDVFDRGHTVQNFKAERAFLNAEKIVARARRKARAAIAAMREPTEAMTGKAKRLMEHPKFTHYDAAFVWRAMIDQALK